MLVQLVVF